jgi:hypothetical protein
MRAIVNVTTTGTIITVALLLRECDLERLDAEASGSPDASG